MWRELAVGIALVTGLRVIGAQLPPTDRDAVRLGAGVSSSDYSCTGCQVDAETGFTALLAGTRSLTKALTVGLEANLSRSDRRPDGCDPARYAGHVGGAWRVPHAAVGHRRPGVVVVFGPIPMVRRSPHAQAWICRSGRASR
jgi:hypothetical protein